MTKFLEKGNDLLMGEEGDDEVNGGKGDDKGTSGEVDDEINGGVGDYILVGGMGRYTFICHRFDQLMNFLEEDNVGRQCEMRNSLDLGVSNYSKSSINNRVDNFIRNICYNDLI